MSDETPLLHLPLILPAQAQKHVTHNEALRLLDLTVQLAVIDRDRTSPPAAPQEGDRYIIATAATGDWQGRANQIAAYWNGAWIFIQPGEGWHARLLDEAVTLVHQGGLWSPAQTEPETLPRLGIAATPDATNRLATSADATLFSHAGAGHQVKVNKATPADTAALLFQTGFSGRAEMGLAGSDAFAIKVSAEGSTFTTALQADPATGTLAIPQGLSAPLALRDSTDGTKRALLDISGLTTGTQRNYTLPNVSSELAALAGTQTFSGAKTFSGAVMVSGGTASIGTFSGTSTYGLGTGTTSSGASKTINIGTGGANGSTTTVAIGPTNPGATGTLTLNGGTVSLGPTVLSFDMGSASARATALGIGGATGDGTNRLAVNSPAVLFNHAGAGVETSINKSSPTAQGMVTFRTDTSPRAQIGLLGSDDLSLRVSADGTGFTTVLTAEAATGRATFAQPLTLAGLASDPATPSEGMLWHNAANGYLSARLSGQTVQFAHQQDIPFLVPPAGEFVATTTGTGGGATGTLAGVAGRMDIFPYLPRADMTVDRLALNCTTAVAAALARICIYAADAFGRPTTLLLESGDIDLATAGARTTTVSFTFRQGRTYWIGTRHSATATLSTWATSATPDMNGGTVSTAQRKVLRRTVAWGTPAPTAWGYTSVEANSAAASAVWLRMA